MQGEYPAEAPFTISELEDIYPAASGKSKVDEAFKARAQEATFKSAEWLYSRSVLSGSTS